MARIAAVALAAAAALAACKKEASPPPGGPAAGAAQPGGTPAGGPAARPAPPIADPGPPPNVPKTVAVDDAVIERFIAFDKQYLAGLPPRMKAMRDELRKVEQTERAKAGPSWRPGSSDGARTVLERMTAEDKRLREAANLSEAQAQTVQELAMMLSTARKQNRDLAEARKRYGDPSVEAALRHEKELIALWEAHMKTFQDAMNIMREK